MNQKILKKILIYFTWLIYIFYISFSNIPFFNLNNKVYAKWNENRVNLSFVIIDKDIYSSIKWDLESYTSIIQKHNANTKVLVMPIDIKIWSIAIRKIIENLYFEWQNWTPSKLNNIILIWNIPLPVVNNGWYIYPTLYPYTDFEKPKYVYNSWDSYRKLNDKFHDNQPEISHSIIKLWSTSDYNDYFKKLFWYYKAPVYFASPSIWYDDIILSKKTFLLDMYNFYLSKLIFSEDLNYNRYTNLLVDLISILTNNSMTNSISDRINSTYNLNASQNTNYDLDSAKDLSSIENKWTAIFKILKLLVWWLVSSSNKDETQINMSDIEEWWIWINAASSKNTPTMFLSKIINNGYIKNYIDIFGNDNINTLKNNLDFGGRYWEKDWQWQMIWSTMAININDKNSVDTIRLFNDKLEKAIDIQIYKERYYVKTPVLQNILEKKNTNKANIVARSKYNMDYEFNVWKYEKIKDSYTNNYFGFPASKLRNAEDMSIRRWNYNNITWTSYLKNYNYVKKSNYMDTVSDFDPTKTSVWWWLGFLSRDVEANKWYNIMDIGNQKDKIESLYFKYFNKDMEEWTIPWYTEDVMQFFSPLKLFLDEKNWNTLTLKQENGSKISKPNMIFSMELDKNLWWPILDIWWWRLADYRHKIWSALTNHENSLSETFEWKIIESSYKNFPKNPTASKDDEKINASIDIAKDCDPISKCQSPNKLTTDKEDRWQKTYVCKNDKWEKIFSFTQNEIDTCNSTTTKAEWSSSIDPSIDPVDVKYDPTKNANYAINQTKKNAIWLSDNYQMYKNFGNPIHERYTPFLSVPWDLKDLPDVFYWSRFTNRTIAKNFYIRTNRWYIDIYRFKDSNLSEFSNINFKDVDFSPEEMKEIFKINETINSPRECSRIWIICSDFLSDCFCGNVDKLKEALKQKLEDQIKEAKTPMTYFWKYWINQDSINKYPFWTQNDAVIYIYNKIRPYIVAFYKDKSIEIGIVKDPAINFEDTINLQFTPKRVYNTKYIYKLVDSRFYHKSPTYDQIYWYDLVIEQPQLEEQLLSTIPWREDISSTVVTSPFWPYIKWIPNLTFVMANEVIALPLKNLLPIINKDDWRSFHKNSRAPSDQAWPFFERDGKSLNIIIKKWTELRVHGKKLLFDKDINFEKFDDLWVIKYKPVKMVDGKKNFYSIWRAWWINETTDERPIDTPRKINFQWIWWSLIEIEYPNLWNIPVYDSNSKIKTIDQIKDSVKEYFEKKIAIYNIALQKQLDARWSHYDKLPSSIWWTISKVDPYSVPNRTYKLFDKNFLTTSLNDDSMWMISDDAIEIIARNLYYANIMRESQNADWSLIKDLKQKYNVADIANKIRYVTEKYISTNRFKIPFTDKDILKNTKDLWDLILPTWNKIWFEIWYINSNWWDFWNTSKESPLLKNIVTEKNNSSEKKKPKADQSDPECWADSNWTVFITKWPKARICRFKNLKNYSIKPKITFNNWEWFKQIWEDRKNFLDNTESQINQYWESRRLVWKSQENQKLLAQKTQKEKQNILWITQNLSIISNSVLWLDDVTKSWNSKIIESSIFSNIDSGIVLIEPKFDLYISATGNNCPTLNGINLCKSQATIWTFDIIKLVSESKIISLWLSETKIWSVWLYYKVCLKWTDTCQYIEKEIQILPWEIKNVKAVTPIQTFDMPNAIKMVKWSKLPLKIIAYDSYKNQIDISPKDYYFWSDWWLINYQWQYSSWFTTNNRNDLNLVYDSSPNKSNSDILWIYNISGFIDNKDSLTNNQKLDIILVNPEISSNINDIEYRLPNSSDKITPSPNNVNSQVQNIVISQNIPSVAITINDWKIRSTANIYSQNKLFTPWFVEKQNILWTNFDIFKKIIPEEDITITGTKKIYIYPNMIAWKDQLIIQIWNKKKIINITILPADPQKIKIITPKNEYSVNQDIKAKFMILDTRWNKADKSVDITVWLFGKLNSKEILYWNWITAIWNVVWETEYIIRTNNPWWNSTIYWYINDENWKYTSLYTPDYKSILINSTSWPKENLDIMYLNLFWNDRWNMRWNNSDVKNLQNTLFTKSSKLIALTTLLQTPSKINKSILSISNNLQISSPANAEIYLEKQNDYIWVNNDTTNWFIPIIPFSKFTINILSDESKISSIDESKSGIYIIKKKNNLTSLSAASPNILINGSVYDRWKYDNTYIKSSSQKINWYNIYNLYYNNNILADILIIGKISTSFTSQDILDLKNIYNPKWLNIWLWFWIDTNTQSIQITNTNENLWSNKTEQETIENSDNHLLSVWFGWKFSNISNFSNWQNVWVATLAWASEFMVNYGDPYVTRVSKSTKVDDVVDNRDGWQWLNIYTAGNEIIDVKTFSLDWDSDKELLVINKKWSIKLLKNFWWRDNRKDYGNIANISDWIAKIWIWDSDWNWYQDIIVETNGHKIRIYKNFDGKIDVDGNQVCLDIAWWPEEIKDVYDMEVYDLNGDWLLDIAVNDSNNKIKIFRWWRNINGDNYISKDKYTCDPDRKTRQANNITQLDWLKLKIINWVNIYDNSMVHYKWLPIWWDKKDYYDWLSTVKDAISSAVNEGWETNIKDASDLMKKPDPTKQKNLLYAKEVEINVKSMKDTMIEVSDVNKVKIDTQDFNNMMSIWKMVKLSNIYTPIYEAWNKSDYVYYLNRQYLTPNDPIYISKVYSDLNGWYAEDWDEVKITVSFTSKIWWIYTYLDKESWPWQIDIDNSWNIIWRNTNWFNDDYKKSFWNSEYGIMIDNLKLSAWQTASYSYTVKYISTKNRLAKMLLNTKSYLWKVQFAWQKSANNKNILSLVPTDSCKKYSLDYSINWDKSYWFNKSNLQEIINENKKYITEKYKKEENKTIDKGMDLWNTLVSTISAWENPYSIKKQIQETRNQNDAYSNRWWIIDTFRDTQSINFNFTKEVNWVIPKLIPQNITNFMNNDLNKIKNKLCNGFNVWNTNDNWVPILPLPSSMAFLSPGIQNFMWCDLPIYWGSSYDKWIPIFSAPTKVLPFVRPPNPAWAWWWFGDWPSLIRIYISPTTTAWLGFAICLWPETLGKKLPKLFRDVVWNCIVFAANLWPNSTPKLPETKTITISPEYADNTNQDTCNIKTDKALTPFVLTNWWKEIPWTNYNPMNPNDGWWLASRFLSPISLWWTEYTYRNTQTINLSDFIEQTPIDITEPDKIEPKIKKDSNKEDWIVACLTENFATPQIEYIKNSITKFWINIYLPNVSSIFWEYDNNFNYIKDDWVNIKWWDTKSAKKYVQNIIKMTPTLETVRQDISKSQKNKYSDIYTWSSWQSTITKALNVLSKSSMQKLNDNTSDPFASIKERLDKSFNTQIVTKNIYIDVPVISTDNILEAKSYFNQRISINDETINDYKNEVKNISANCGKYWWNPKSCKNKISEITRVITTYQSTKNSVLQNTKTLELYNEYPLQIYRLIKLQDQYLVDISNLFNQTIGYLSSRLNRNIHIITSYLDTFTTLIWVIKSRQVIINIWVNFKTKCSSCTVDNYSYYSCSFKWFCPKFPIFKIPPFRIPKITLDFSKVNLWALITMPKYIFRSKPIDTSVFFQLPNLPNIWPYWVDMNIKLPKVPLIPGPPNLEFIQLPSFIPQIKWNLPSLPPAPRIPKIAPEISLAVDIIDFVSNIYCFLKKWLPLVWEKWVKNKVEQLTQRSWTNDLFDFSVLKYPVWFVELTNLWLWVWWSNWYDFRIESQIDFKANFEWVYEIFDNIAKGINNKTNEINKEINNTKNNIENEIQKNTNEIKIPTSTSDIIPKYVVKKDYSYNTIYNKDISETEDYQTTRKNMMKDRSYLKQKIISDYHWEQNIWEIDWLLQTLQNNSKVRLSDNITNMSNQVNNIVNKHLKESDKLKNDILYNYDNWLKSIQEDQLVSDNEVLMNTKVKIFETDDYTKNLINTYENPNISYLKISKQLIDWYKHVLQKQPEKTLLDQTNIDLIKNEAVSLSTNIDKAIDIIKNPQSDKTISSNREWFIAQKSVFAENNDINKNSSIITSNTRISKINTDNIRLADQCPDSNNPSCPEYDPNLNNTNWWTEWNSTNTNNANWWLYWFDNIPQSVNLWETIQNNYNATDDSQYIEWLFIQWYKNLYYNIMDSTAKSKEIKKISQDINNDGAEDIILRNAKNIYIKYNEQSEKPILSNFYQWYYELPSIDNIDKLNGLTNWLISLWWISNIISSDKYKVRSSEIWAYNFDNQWQEYDNISYKRSNDKERSRNWWWYILRFSSDIQDHGKENNPSNVWRQYILIIPNTIWYQNNQKVQTNMDENSFSIKSDYISNLKDKKIINSIKTYNISNDDISTTLLNIDRLWYYAQISKINLKDNVWTKASSWTSQKNWWPQVASDKDAPNITPWWDNWWWSNWSWDNISPWNWGWWNWNWWSCSANVWSNDINLIYNDKSVINWWSLKWNINSWYKITIQNKSNKQISWFNLKNPAVSVNCLDKVTSQNSNWKITLWWIICDKQTRSNIQLSVQYKDGSKEDLNICIEFSWPDGYDDTDNTDQVYWIDWLSFIRSRTNKLISKWFVHEWNILTSYTLSWYREDNIKFASYNRYIQLQSWQKLNPQINTWWFSNSPIVNITWIYSNIPTDIYYIIEWKDAQWNKKKISIKVNLWVPDIDITNISKKDWLTTVQTQVASQMDDASIAYQKNTDWQISQLVSNDNIYKYNLWIEQTQLDWWLFKFENWYKLYNWSGKVIWFVFDNGNIYMVNNNYKITTDISTNIPIIKIKDNLKNTLFDIQLKPTALKSVYSYSSSYKVVRLPRNYSVSEFGWWYCLSTNWQANWCKLFFSTIWKIWFSSEIHNYNLNYQFSSWYVNYEIYEWQNKVWLYWIQVSVFN